jgi:hypothetical protein
MNSFTYKRKVQEPSFTTQLWQYLMSLCCMFRPYRPLSDTCIYNSIIEKIRLSDWYLIPLPYCRKFENSFNVLNLDIAETWGNLPLMCEQVVLKMYTYFFKSCVFSIFHLVDFSKISVSSWKWLITFWIIAISANYSLKIKIGYIQGLSKRFERFKFCTFTVSLPPSGCNMK